jgi:hypothetical protein
MKSLIVFLALTIGAVGLCAQDTPQTTPPPPPPMRHAHSNIMAMHQHMMKTQDQSAKMRATLEKMKANVSKISDPALKQQVQYDVDLWEEMVQHMESMSQMMKAHSGMGMKSGMGGMGMGHPPMPPSDQKPVTPEKK